MSSLLSVVRRHPIITFFVLSYALAWMLVPFGSFGAYGPLVAALIVVPITQGVAGLKELGLRVIRWRVRWYWYAVALGVPLAVHLAVVGLNVASGAGVPTLTFASLTTFLMVFAIRLINPTDGPLGENPGWQGFALPGLQGSGYSPLVATAIVAPLVSLWHLAPLLLGAGRLAAVCPGGRPRGDDGGDDLLQLAVQPHRRQRAPRHPGARPRGKHPVRDRMDRYGGLVGGRDRVDRLRPEGLARSRARTGDYGATDTTQRSGTGVVCLARGCRLSIGVPGLVHPQTQAKGEGEL